MAIKDRALNAEKSFKQVLYRFLEELHCTKAAVYLRDESGTLILITQYGFGRTEKIAAEHEVGSKLASRLHQQRFQPVFSNAPEDDEVLSGLLPGIERFMLVPIYGRKGLYGAVDARQKGGNKAFMSADIDPAKAIAKDFVELIEAHRLAFFDGEADADDAGVEVELSTDEVSEPEQEIDVNRDELIKDLEVLRRPRRPFLDRPGLIELIEEAGSAVDGDGVTAVVLSLVEESVGHSLCLSQQPLDAERISAVRAHQQNTLAEQGRQSPYETHWTFEQRSLDIRDAGDGSEANQMIVTAVLASDEIETLLASAIGPMGRTELGESLGRLGLLAGACLDRASQRWSRRSVLLRLHQAASRGARRAQDHGRAVSQLAWAMARRMGADDTTVEAAAVAGLVHDLGITMLGFAPPEPGDRLSTVQRQQIARHPALGARLLIEAGLPREAEAVLSHHERWDGEGYPQGLEGEEIPLLARIIQIAEAFETMTSEHTYREPVEVDQALAILREEGGKQFDSSLIDLLDEVLH